MILLTSMRLAIALGALVLIAVSPARAVFGEGYLMQCEAKQVHAILGYDGTVRPLELSGSPQWNKFIIDTTTGLVRFSNNEKAEKLVIIQAISSSYDFIGATGNPMLDKEPTALSLDIKQALQFGILMIRYFRGYMEVPTFTLLYHHYVLRTGTCKILS